MAIERREIAGIVEAVADHPQVRAQRQSRSGVVQSAASDSAWRGRRARSAPVVAVHRLDVAVGGVERQAPGEPRVGLELEALGAGAADLS